MRILGFSKKWDKLQNDVFTTFRFPRKDKDWQVGEVVQIVYKPRSKEREVLGIAEIVYLWGRHFGFCTNITDKEAVLDGFSGYTVMKDCFYKMYGDIIFDRPINKLTLKWLTSSEFQKREASVIELGGDEEEK